MLMRERSPLAFHRRDGQAVDVVAAAGEQADDAREDARLVVDQDRDRRAAQCGVGHVGYPIVMPGASPGIHAIACARGWRSAPAMTR